MFLVNGFVIMSSPSGITALKGEVTLHFTSLEKALRILISR